MDNKLLNLKPESVWNYFYQLTQIPRPSKHEEKVQDFMVNFGKSLGLETIKDEIGNVIIRKPATAGMENRKGVILQAHLDMVPQANSNKVHNFETDPITAYVDGEWVTADGTTLGADNGMGVATAMAILASTNIEHGPIEALFTIDEETGMTGANNLKPNVLKGDILLNLDYEDEGELCVGCAGGVNAKFTFDAKLKTAPLYHVAYSLSITGLKGGHSGLDIALGRANANKLMFRLLTKMIKEYHILLDRIECGNMRNAIPREAFVTVLVPDSLVKSFTADVIEFEKTVKAEYASADPDLTIKLEAIDMPSEVISDGVGSRLAKSVFACPDGVIRMSPDVPGLVETSTNLAIVKRNCNKIEVCCLLRSSVDSAKQALAEQMACVFEMAEAECEFDGAYPGWKPNMNSEILEVMRKTSKEIFGHEAEVKAVHAGLECGIMGAKYPNWDMVAFGPTLRHPHSPDEKVNIASVERFYNWVLLTLKNIPTA